MTTFSILGCGGYIAPKHMKAICELDGDINGAMDVTDSVGLLDSYSKEVEFFTNFEEFDYWLEKNKTNYLTICTPNYLHTSHISCGLRKGINVICEKPLTLNPNDLYELKKLEEKHQSKVYTILQLRHHPSIKKLKEKIENESRSDYCIDLSYVAPRGKWYLKSWKNDPVKSGGLETNLGIHFFDMLIWIFGKVVDYKIYTKNDIASTGMLKLEKAEVIWRLSTDKTDLPNSNMKSYRSLLIDGEEFNFSTGFEDLHTTSYKEILEGRGFGIREVEDVIKLVYNLRNDTPNSDNR